MTPPPSAAAAQPARRVIAPPRPGSTPSRPRRVSGPARPQTRTAPPEESRDGLIVGLLGAAEAVSSHRLLDRLIRGRLWIGIVAFALIGIVTLQLSLLKLNSGIGRSLERAATLRTENAALSIENSELASGTRVESQAGRLGMALSPVASLHFLSTHGALDASRAAQVLRKALVPGGEPPGATEAETAAITESGAASTGTESSTSSESHTQEPETSPSGGEAQTATRESAGSSTGGETGAASAPTTGASATTPTGGETSSEAGGGTAGPGG